MGAAALITTMLAVIVSVPGTAFAAQHGGPSGTDADLRQRAVAQRQINGLQSGWLTLPWVQWADVRASAGRKYVQVYSCGAEVKAGLVLPAGFFQGTRIRELANGRDPVFELDFKDRSQVVGVAPLREQDVGLPIHLVVHDHLPTPADRERHYPLMCRAPVELPEAHIKKILGWVGDTIDRPFTFTGEFALLEHRWIRYGEVLARKRRGIGDTHYQDKDTKYWAIDPVTSALISLETQAPVGGWPDTVPEVFAPLMFVNADDEQRAVASVEAQKRADREARSAFWSSVAGGVAVAANAMAQKNAELEARDASSLAQLNATIARAAASKASPQSPGDGQSAPSSGLVLAERAPTAPPPQAAIGGASAAGASRTVSPSERTWYVHCAVKMSAGEKRSRIFVSEIGTVSLAVNHEDRAKRDAVEEEFYGVARAAGYTGHGGGAPCWYTEHANEAGRQRQLDSATEPAVLLRWRPGN
jgi:hypothetical protein